MKRLITNFMAKFLVLIRILNINFMATFLIQVKNFALHNPEYKSRVMHVIIWPDTVFLDTIQMLKSL